jgi:hypothetical protein
MTLNPGDWNDIDQSQGAQLVGGALISRQGDGNGWIAYSASYVGGQFWLSKLHAWANGVNDLTELISFDDCALCAIEYVISNVTQVSPLLRHSRLAARTEAACFAAEMKQFLRATARTLDTGEADKVLPVVVEDLMERIISKDAGTVSHACPADVKQTLQVR